MIFSNLFKLSLVACLAISGVEAEYKLKSRPAKGVTGVYYDSGTNTMEVYYGNDIKEHAQHVAETINGQSFTYAGDRDEHQQNRKDALSGKPTLPGHARDEKPPASMSKPIPGVSSTVKHLPAVESSREGGLLSTLAGMIKALEGQAYGSSIKIKYIDNRDGATILATPKSGFLKRAIEELASALVERNFEEEDLDMDLFGRDSMNLGSVDFFPSQLSRRSVGSFGNSAFDLHEALLMRRELDSMILSHMIRV